METSKPVMICQRPRVWCKPGLISGLKINPEPQVERERDRASGNRVIREWLLSKLNPLSPNP